VEKHTKIKLKQEGILKKKKKGAYGGDQNMKPSEKIQKGKAGKDKLFPWGGVKARGS